MATLSAVSSSVPQKLLQLQEYCSAVLIVQLAGSVAWALQQLVARQRFCCYTPHTTMPGGPRLPVKRPIWMDCPSHRITGAGTSMHPVCPAQCTMCATFSDRHAWQPRTNGCHGHVWWSSVLRVQERGTLLTCICRSRTGPFWQTCASRAQANVVSRAYIHWYQRSGCELPVICEAAETMASTAAAYEAWFR